MLCVVVMYGVIGMLIACITPLIGGHVLQVTYQLYLLYAVIKGEVVKNYLYWLEVAAQFFPQV